MSLNLKMVYKTEDQENHEVQSELMLNIKSSTLSERAKLGIPTVIVKKVRSENQVESKVNYDDLCGPWIYSKNSVYNRYFELPIPKLCIWKYFTKEDLIYLKKHQKDRNAVFSFFENKFSNEYKGQSMTILVKMLWEFFKFMRFHSFTEKSTSASLGLIYLIHSFFLARPWWTAQEVYQFFREAVLLHAVLNPPKSLEVFTVNETTLLLEAFHEICMENLILLHILYHPSCYFSLNLSTLTHKN